VVCAKERLAMARPKTMLALRRIATDISKTLSHFKVSWYVKGLRRGFSIAIEAFEAGSS
jgi:hypothetical protein